jgi:predicted transcriptional regulator
MARKKAQQLTAIMVRLPEPLRRKLARLASAGGRSMNSEIIRRLEDSVSKEEPLPPEVERVLARVEEEMRRRDALEADLLLGMARMGATPEELKKVIWQVYGKEEKS